MSTLTQDLSYLTQDIFTLTQNSSSLTQDMPDRTAIQCAGINTIVNMVTRVCQLFINYFIINVSVMCQSLQREFITFLPSPMQIIEYRTKVLSVQLGKILGLTKVPTTETEESTDANNYIYLVINYIIKQFT